MKDAPVKYNKTKEAVDVLLRSKFPKISKTKSDNELILNKVKETLTTMTDIDEPITSSRREIILVVNILVWIITFTAMVVGFSSPHSSLRFVS